MNRREFSTTIIAAGAMPFSSQIGTSSTIVISSPSIEDRKKEYAICKVRGHQIDPLAGNFTPAIYPPPAPRYTCRFCGTTYWTESVDRETNIPE